MIINSVTKFETIVMLDVNGTHAYVHFFLGLFLSAAGEGIYNVTVEHKCRTDLHTNNVLNCRLAHQAPRGDIDVLTDYGIMETTTCQQCANAAGRPPVTVILLLASDSLESYFLRRAIRRASGARAATCAA